MNKPITSFHGPYRFLSNFYPAIVQLDGVEYPTVEHAYQAAKTDNPTRRALIREASLPSYAKRRGKGLEANDPTWAARKIEVMEGLLRQKFALAPLRLQLLATGDAMLVENNNYRDSFWGVYQNVGSNHLGVLLMKIRAEAQAQTTARNTDLADISAAARAIINTCEMIVGAADRLHVARATRDESDVRRLTASLEAMRATATREHVQLTTALLTFTEIDGWKAARRSLRRRTEYMSSDIHSPTCAGNIVVGAPGTDQEHRYCSRCGAFRMGTSADPLPTGKDRIKNAMAWNDSDVQSPDESTS